MRIISCRLLSGMVTPAGFWKSGMMYMNLGLRFSASSFLIVS